MYLNYLSRHLYQMISFGIGVGDTLDIFQYIFRFCRCHRMGIGKATEQLGSNLINSFVSTLGTEYYRNQQLENISKFQLSLYFWHLLPKILEDVLISILLFHKRKIKIIK